MKTPTVAILNGLINPIPPIKGGGPQIVIYNTCQELDCVSFDWFVLSNWASELENEEYDKEKFIAVKTQLIDRAIVWFTILFPNRVVKGIFGVVRKDHLLLNIKLIRNLLLRKVDMIIVHDSYSLTYLCHLVFPRKRIIFYHHSCRMHIDLNEKRWNRLVRSASSGIISICAKAFDYTDKKFLQKPSQKKVIINGVVDLNLYTKDSDFRDRLRKQFGIGQDEFVFIYVGRIHEQKGLDLLINAFSEAIQNSQSSVRLLIVGSAHSDEDGSIQYETMLKSKAEKLANDKILFTGFIQNDRLLDYYMISDVGILPTRLLEGNSLFLMECLTMGIPVIATRKGGVPEVVRDGIDGILINEEDLEEELSQTMLSLMRDVKTWRLRKAEIAQSARERFAFKRVAKEFCQVIDSLLDN